MGRARTAFIGLDACDYGIAQGLMAEGRMPNLAALLERGISAPTAPPLGLFVGSIWPSIFTGGGPGSHGVYSWRQFQTGRYETRRFSPHDIGLPPLWEPLSQAGMDVAVIDPPLAAVSPATSGLQIMEWGSHDRWSPLGTAGPLAQDLVESVGPHPIRVKCDHVARHDTRTSLLDQLIEGNTIKTDLSLAALDAGNWDLFITVMSETHCAGHHFWHLHEPTNDMHDPDELARFDDDPLHQVYDAVDTNLGRLLAGLRPDTTVYVLLSHGFQHHYGGEHLLGEILARIEATIVPRSRVRIGREHVHRLAHYGRKRLRARFADGDRTIASLFGGRAFFAVPNNELFGGIRLNLAGREPRGWIEPGAPQSESLIEQLIGELHALRDPDTGRKLVTRVLRTDDHHPGARRQNLPDLLVDWDRQAQINAAASDTIGVVRRRYEGVRSGDHRPIGRLIVAGPGVDPAQGASAGAVSMEDVAPTVCASLGFDFDAVDGAVATALVPGA